MGKIKITLKKSVIGKPQKIRRIISAMGLKKIRQSKIFEDTPVIRGMINKTYHMIEVENIE